MKNHHVSSLPANAKSQRAALPSLLGAVAGGSSLFQGSGTERVGGAPCPPTPAVAAGRRVGCTGLGEEVTGWDVCECPGVCVHGFWQEVIEVT